MAKKTGLTKAPPKPRTADEFVMAGRQIQPAAGEPMKRFTLDVPRSLHTRIKKACADRGEPMADVLREILEREFPR
ncbi:hypothetical protein [Microvirga sp. G4-2]|uniref:hypothetical protein n=1 Tax=Microvirga sp. G4-2 TaxID=3434467 RepID=UPI004043C4B2